MASSLTISAAELNTAAEWEESLCGLAAVGQPRELSIACPLVAEIGPSRMGRHAGGRYRVTAGFIGPPMRPTRVLMFRNNLSPVCSCFCQVAPVPKGILCYL
jgi:hypothetical protein